jgi:hypothetical protein
MASSRAARPAFLPIPVRILVFAALVFALLLAALGCSTDDPNGPSSAPTAPTPTPPAPGAPLDTAPSGVLRVRVAGLPPGVPGAITVTGPNGFSRDVRE